MTETPSQLPPPAYRNPSDDERLNGLRTLTHILYALYAVHWLTGGITSLVALIIDYVKRDDVAGTPYADHVEWQIRTFWRTLIGYVVGIALMYAAGLTFTFAPALSIGYPIVFAGVGFPLLGATCVWALYRIIKGWLFLNDNKTLDPQAWF
ncbi:DUF4870 family protein [Burkholderia guangdongensis]|uniref:DUF4870 family protein n=1 Tax=Burkholderia guangdongensis TaxID=1792500 RepID=UPI0015C6AC5C|nr:hypothetical protein [Burkholderia guangdongensis]